MKRLILTLCCLTCLSLAAVTAVAQPAPMDSPTPVMTTPMTPTATMAPTMAVPSPQPAMAAPMGVPVAMTAPAATMAPDKLIPTVIAPPVAKSIPETKTTKFWVVLVVTPVLTMVVTLLLVFGVWKSSWSKWMREKQVYTIADKVCSTFEGYADDGKKDWKDIAALCLRAVTSRLGQLSDYEKDKVEKVVEDRIEQALNKS